MPRQPRSSLDNLVAARQRTALKALVRTQGPQWCWHCHFSRHWPRPGFWAAVKLLSRLEPTPKHEKEVWQAFHAPASKNVDCSSHAMETEAALRMQRRTQSYQMQFTTVLSDGDSKAYTALCEALVYGTAQTMSSCYCTEETEDSPAIWSKAWQRGHSEAAALLLGRDNQP